jgi:hypothetical protein
MIEARPIARVRCAGINDVDAEQAGPPMGQLCGPPMGQLCGPPMGQLCGPPMGLRGRLGLRGRPGLQGRPGLPKGVGVARAERVVAEVAVAVVVRRAARAAC